MASHLSRSACLSRSYAFFLLHLGRQTAFFPPAPHHAFGESATAFRSFLALVGLPRQGEGHHQPPAALGLAGVPIVKSFFLSLSGTLLFLSFFIPVKSQQPSDWELPPPLPPFSFFKFNDRMPQLDHMSVAVALVFVLFVFVVAVHVFFPPPGPATFFFPALPLTPTPTPTVFLPF